MLDYMYEWLRNVAFYLVIVTAVLHILPSDTYKKYIRFFTGLVLILMLLSPFLKLFGRENTVTDIYKGYNFEEKIDRFEKERKEIEESVRQETNSSIEVEEIVIGP